MNKKKQGKKGDGYVYCSYIIKNGKKIFPKKSKVFKFKIKPGNAA